MSVVNLELFKQHVKADDFADDDKYMQFLLTTAEEAVIAKTNRTSEELIEMGGGAMPHRIGLAILQLASHWYNQRESAAVVEMREVPESLSALVKPFRKLV